MIAVARLKRRPDFLRVAGGRRKWVAPGLILQALRQHDADAGTDDIAPARVGFTASAKVGNAVVRNRARRRLRAAAAAVLPRHAQPAHDYVLIARAGTLTRRFSDLTADLEAGLKRLGLYRDDAETRTAEGRAGNSHAA
ncbi:MAG: ribonuclease P protein component [Dongiaceae bacterium]